MFYYSTSLDRFCYNFFFLPKNANARVDDDRRDDDVVELLNPISWQLIIHYNDEAIIIFYTTIDQPLTWPLLLLLRIRASSTYPNFFQIWRNNKKLPSFTIDKSDDK